MSGESVNNSAELTLGINTKSAETAIGELQTKLNGLVENLDKLNKAAGVQHVVSPEAIKEIDLLTQKNKTLEATLDGFGKGGANTGNLTAGLKKTGNEATETTGKLAKLSYSIALLNGTKISISGLSGADNLAANLGKLDTRVTSYSSSLTKMGAVTKSQYQSQLQLGNEVVSMLKRQRSEQEALGNANVAIMRRELQLLKELKAAYVFNAPDNLTPKGKLVWAAQQMQANQGDSAAASVFNSAVISAIPNITQYEKEVKKLASAKDNLATNTKKSSASSIHWNTIANESHSLARGLAGSLNMLWLTWGSTAPLLAGAAISGSLRGVVQSGKDVEYQLRFVQELSGSAAVSISELSKAMEGTLQTPKQAAEGMRALAQAGLDTKQALEALPTILNLATVGELSMKDAALGATGVMHAFGLEVSDLAHIGDVFAKSAAISNTSVEGMVGAMKYASTVAEVYNVSLEEVSAALTVMAKRNIESTSAGTALRNMMNEFAAPTDKARSVMEKLGFSAFDANKKLKDLPTLLDDLKRSLSGLSEQSQIEALNKLFGERGGKAIAALIKDTGEFTKVLRTLREEADGFTSSVAAGLGDTVEGQFKRAAAEIQKSFVSVFMDTNDGIKALTASIADLFASDGFREFVRDVVEGIMTAVQITKEWADELKILALGFVAFKAGELALAGLAIAAGKAASGIALLSGVGATLDVARVALAATAKGIQGVEIVGSPVLTSMVQGFGSFAFAVGGIVPAMALAGGAVAALGVAVALAAKDWWDMAEARAKDEAAMKSWQVTSNSILGSLNRESEELTKNISKIRERNQAILEGRSLDTGSEAQPSGVAKLAQGIESQIANMKAKGGFKYVDGTWGGVSQEDLSELARREADYLKAAATDAGNATKRGVQREENDRARVVAEFDRLRDSVASAYRKKQTPEALSILTELSRSTDLPTADLRQLVSRLSSKADGSVLSTVNFGKDSKSSAAANDARRAEIATTQGWLRELSQLEKQAQDELATSYNDGIVSASEYWEGRLELANSYTALEISAIDNLIANQKDLTKTELAQLTAKKKLLEGQLDGGNAADNARKQSDAQAKLKRSYDQIVAAAEKQIALYRNDTVYESLARQTDEFGRQRLEIDRTVEAFKLSEIAKVEALNVANKQNKDLTEAQLAGINRLTEAERQALEERLALNRANEGNWVNGATEAWKAWKDSANNAAKITKESFTRVFQKVDEVFLDFIRTGKLNFKSLGQTIKDEVIKLLYELTVKKFVIGITGDFSNLALALGGTALKSILGVSGGGGSTSGSGTNYTGLASNASTAYSVYGGAKAAYAAYQGTAAGLSASETGAATWAYLQSGDFGTALGVALKGALGTEASTATTAASLEAYYAAQGLEASTMGVATEAGLGGAAGLSWASALFAIPFIAKFFNDRSRPLPLEFTGLGVDGQYDGKNFDGTLATNYMRGGSYWDQRMQLTNDAAIVAQNYQNLKPPVIEIANPDYTTWQNAYQEAGFQNQIGDNAYRNGDETFYAPSKISGYDEGYTPAPYSTDPTVLGNIDAAIEAAFNAPKSAMKKVAELFGDAELATQIDAFTAKISVSGRNIGEILGKIGAQVTTDLGQAFLPSIEAARVQGAALRTGLETAIANATTAGDTEAVNTLKAQMEAIGIAASETWSQTFERVLKETDAVSKAMDLLGVSLKDIGDANKVLTLSDNLVTLFGGIDALNTSVNAYYGNFYTEAEKQERVWKNMGETFKSLNLAMPTTREGFRDLVEAQDLTTTAGQQTFVALMNVQGAFADLTPAMNAAATAAEALAVTAEQLGSAKSALMGYFTTAQRRSVLTGNIYDTALENGVDLGGESLTNLSNASRQDFAAYVQSVANEGTEASRRMLVALAAIAPAFEDLVAIAEAAAAADLQAAIDVTQSAIDALTGQYGDVATAMLEINPPAKTLVESWRDNKTALEALQGTFDQFFGVTIPDAAATIQSLLTQLSAFEGGAETARSNADNARLQGMTPTERAAFWRNQEATLWQGLGNSTDKAGTISKIMDAYANTRAAELDALTGEQTKLNDAQKTGIQDQIDAWKTTLSVIEQSKRLVEDIDKTLAGLAYSDLSNLGYTDQLGAASSSYSNTLSKAAAGDTNAMGNLTSIARDYLTEAQTYFGGATLDYSNVYDKVTGDLRGLGMGLNTDGTGAQSEIDRLTASLSRIPGDLKAAFDTQTAEGYERIATALDAGTQYSTARLDEQKAQLQTQIDQQKVVIANQEAQIRQQADNHAALMERLAEQNARLAALESNSNLTVAA